MDVKTDLDGAATSIYYEVDDAKPRVVNSSALLVLLTHNRSSNPIVCVMNFLQGELPGQYVRDELGRRHRVL